MIGLRLGSVLQRHRLWWTHYCDLAGREPCLCSCAEAFSIRSHVGRRKKWKRAEPDVTLTSLLQGYLFTSETSDRIHPHKNRHDQPCVNGENSDSETILSRHSVCLCVRQSLFVWHMHINTNHNFVIKHIQLFLPSAFALVSSWQSNFDSLFSSTAPQEKKNNNNNPPKNPSSSVGSEPESKQRPTNSFNFYQCAGWQGVSPFSSASTKTRANTINQYLWSMPGWSVSIK